MFGICNSIAYGGLMVYGTAPDRERLDAPPSTWVHVVRSEYDVDAAQIMVVSPFRDVADGIERLVREFPGVRGGPRSAPTWSTSRSAGRAAVCT